jgi:hypothetical protein
MKAFTLKKTVLVHDWQPHPVLSVFMTIRAKPLGQPTRNGLLCLWMDAKSRQHMLERTFNVLCPAVCRLTNTYTLQLFLVVGRKGEAGCGPQMDANAYLNESTTFTAMSHALKPLQTNILTLSLVCICCTKLLCPTKPRCCPSGCWVCTPPRKQTKNNTIKIIYYTMPFYSLYIYIYLYTYIHIYIYIYKYKYTHTIYYKLYSGSYRNE